MKVNKYDFAKRTTGTRAGVDAKRNLWNWEMGSHGQMSKKHECEMPSWVESHLSYKRGTGHAGDFAQSLRTRQSCLVASPVIERPFRVKSTTVSVPSAHSGGNVSDAFHDSHEHRQVTWLTGRWRAGHDRCSGRQSSVAFGGGNLRPK